MTSYKEATTEEIIEILKEYIDDEDENLMNLKYIAEHGIENKKWKDVTFKFMYGNLILNTKDLSYKDAEPQLPIEDFICEDDDL